MTGWAVAGVIAKFCLYLAGAAGIGGIFTLLLIRTCQGSTPGEAAPGTRGVLAGCCLGLVTAVVYFLVRVGEFAASGLSGMTDPVFIEILWQSPEGSALVGKAAGFVALILALALSFRAAIQPGSRRLYAAIVLYIGGAAAIAYTFSFTGHSANLGSLGSAAIALHVLAALWWAGALYPLWKATGRLAAGPLQVVLHRFGQIAAGVVLMVVVAGGTLLYLLIGSRIGEVTLGYALGLGAKLSLVVLLFLLAAYHKWVAVPRLSRPGGTARFQRSLIAEVATALAILAATAILSTALGPFHGA